MKRCKVGRCQAYVVRDSYNYCTDHLVDLRRTKAEIKKGNQQMSKKHGFNKQAETTKVGAHLVCVSCCGEEICPAPCFKIDCQCGATPRGNAG